MRICLPSYNSPRSYCAAFLAPGFSVIDLLSVLHHWIYRMEATIAMTLEAVEHFEPAQYGDNTELFQSWASDSTPAPVDATPLDIDMSGFDPEQSHTLAPGK